MINSYRRNRQLASEKGVNGESDSQSPRLKDVYKVKEGSRCQCYHLPEDLKHFTAQGAENTSQTLKIWAQTKQKMSFPPERPVDVVLTQAENKGH